LKALVDREFISHNRVMLPFSRALADGFIRKLQAMQKGTLDREGGSAGT